MNYTGFLKAIFMPIVITKASSHLWHLAFVFFKCLHDTLTYDVALAK